MTMNEEFLVCHVFIKLHVVRTTLIICFRLRGEMLPHSSD